MGLADRRAFQAGMALKYCGGNPRQAETLFGWSRYSVELGLHEKRTGITCLGAHSVYGGNKLWEERHPAVAEALWGLAATHSQQDPTFRTTLSYTRLTAAEALKQLRAQGFAEDTLPCPSTLAEVLNRNGYRLRPVIKSKPKKKIPQTDAIFENLHAKDGHSSSDDNGKVKRLSIDCKATVNIGDYSRGGKTRGDRHAEDHDLGCKEKYTPFGVVDEGNAKLHILFGSSAKTSDFIVDCLGTVWDSLPQAECEACSSLSK